MRQRIGLLCTGLLAASASLAAAQLSVTDWDLTTGVQDLSIPTQAVDFTFAVANPLLLTQSAQLASGGTAATAYDFAWSGDEGSFRVDMSHLTPDLGNDFYRSLSTGDIYFTTGVPLIAHLTGSYTYFLPASGMNAGVTLRMKDVRETSYLFNEPRLADTILSPAPQSGTFTWDRTVLVPANSQCNILYDFQLNARQNSGALATGSGSFTLTFEPVPEPCALTLLGAVVGVWMQHRSRRTRIA